jgi:hypothetical protein
MKTHLVLCGIGAIAFPIVFAWETFKRGWLTKWTTSNERRNDDLTKIISDMEYLFPA